MEKGMHTQAKAKEVSKGAGLILFGASIISLVWLTVLGFLLFHSQGCKGLLHDAGILEKWIGCRPANEIGDFLSGGFAPLAFIWLAVAVIIQSRELRLQREELELTRADARETRKAIEAQAEESRKQAEYIGVQTAILQSEDNERNHARLNRQFDELLAIVADLMAEPLGARTLWDQENQGIVAYMFEIKQSPGIPIREQVGLSIAEAIDHEQNVIRNIDDDLTKLGSPERFGELIECIVEMLEIHKHMDTEGKIRVRRLRLVEFLSLLERYQVKYG